jgi:2-succinyl-6-hydroxy-2,4-cyclohexadiene-1-carboxylate synthase
VALATRCIPPQLDWPGQGGEAGKTKLVLLHGFTQTGASWSPVARLLEDRFDMLLPDSPGHGGSSQVRAGLWETADLLAEAATGPACWAGYSMGGRMALHVALAHPEVVTSLVLVSTNPGIEDPVARRERQVADEALAARIQREGVESFLHRWLDQPLFATLSRPAAGLGERLANTAEGLASSLRLAGVGTQEPLWARLEELRTRSLPVLLITGELDQAYCRHAARMAELIGPSARSIVVDGAGHACHLEKPDEVAAAVSAFCP